MDRSEVHQICAHEAGEYEKACDCGLRGVCQAQQQIDDEGDGDVGAHGVLGAADEVVDLEGVLDPAEEQLDVPTLLVNAGDGLGGSGGIVGDDAEHGASVEPPCTSRKGLLIGFLRLLAMRSGAA